VAWWSTIKKKNAARAFAVLVRPPARPPAAGRLPSSDPIPHAACSHGVQCSAVRCGCIIVVVVVVESNRHQRNATQRMRPRA
jgi:hypothetical protein